MSKINLVRVLIGGLVAGVVYNIGEAILNTQVIATEIEQITKDHNLPAIGNEFIIKATIVMFIVGILTVYLYAAIRPRFGAGVKTAACAGLFVWFFMYLVPSYFNMSMGLVPAGTTWLAVGWTLVESVLASIAGAWLYKESAS